MKHALRVGSAWKTPTAGKPDKFHYGGKLDTGSMIPGIRVRIVENTKKNDESPDLVVFYTPADSGEEAKDLQIGALWKHGDYHLGRLQPQRLGVVRCAGGAVVDFRLVAEEIGIKLVALKEPTEKGPTHLLMRLSHAKKAVESPVEASPVPVPDLAEFEEGEEEEESEEDVPF